MMLTGRPYRQLARRIFVGTAVVVAIGAACGTLLARNDSVNGQDACSLECKEAYQLCKANCDPGDNKCVDRCERDRDRCLNDCN